jgi:hypothetical protein
VAVLQNDEVFGTQSANGLAALFENGDVEPEKVDIRPKSRLRGPGLRRSERPNGGGQKEHKADLEQGTRGAAHR